MKRFLLVYGSQTGQSQVISEQIAEKATSKGFKVDVNCLDQSGAKVSYPVNGRCNLSFKTSAVEFDELSYCNQHAHLY